MSSYSTTTLLPPSPSRVCPHTVVLPHDDEQLVMMCLWIDKYLDQLWTSYLRYAEMVRRPESSKVFSILFSEMDFFEVIKGRIMSEMASRTNIKGLYNRVL